MDSMPINWGLTQGIGEGLGSALSGLATMARITPKARAEDAAKSRNDKIFRGANGLAQMAQPPVQAQPVGDAVQQPPQGAANAMGAIAPGGPGAPTPAIPQPTQTPAQQPASAPAQGNDPFGHISDEDLISVLRDGNSSPEDRQLALSIYQPRQAQRAQANGPEHALDMKYKQAQIDQLTAKQGDEFVSAGDGRVFNKRTGAFVEGGPAPAAKGVAADMQARAQYAQDHNMDVNDPRTDSWIRTGKDPREDAQPLTAGDKMAIRESDEMVNSGKAAITNLNRALDINGKALYGPLAGSAGYVGSLLGSETGEATQELDNVVQTNALTSLKSIFGGNPTEGERAILLEIQGSSNKAPDVRKGIYERAIKAAEQRIKFNQDRADEMRGGTYYKPKTEGQNYPKAPPVGAKVDGYTYKGGDPASPSSWEQ